MKVRRWIPFVSLTVLSLILATAAVAQEGQLWVGPNVNMVSGTTFPDGDPFLQRQNEPSAAVSTRNTMHVVGFVNDYRAVDIPFLIDDKTTGDAWLGVFKSFDGGETWRSTLLPGYPQEENSVSPIFGYQAGADPVVRAGTHGLFYLSGIVFDRGEDARSAVFVSRYMDLNNVEGGDPISYIDTNRVAWNDVGDYFIDKPWLAVDIPRGAPNHNLLVYQDGIEVPQTVQCGNVYLAWAEISGESPNIRSTIRFSRSTDCGETWSETPIALSNLDTMNQGVTIAVSPLDGDVSVAWRQFDTTTTCTQGGGYWKNHPEEWPVDSLTLGGDIKTKQELLDILNTPKKAGVPYILAQQLIPAKLNFFGSLVGSQIQTLIAAADAWLIDNPLGTKPKGSAKDEGLALKDQLEDYNDGTTVGEDCLTGGGPGDSIMVTRSEDGGETFSSPTVVSQLHHFGQGTTEISFRTNSYPTMTVDDTGRAYLAWATRGLATPRDDAVDGDARIVVSTATDTDPSTWTTPQPIDEPETEGHQIEPSIAFAGGKIILAYYDLRRDISGVFERFIADWTDLPTYRHTVDVRAAHAAPADYPVFTDYTPVTPGGSAEHPSDQVSRYAFTTNESGELELIQLHFNPPNLPIFVAGTMAFFGDYIDIVPSPPFLPDLGGGWRYNSLPEDGAVFHAVWTDNRDVEAPHDGDWTNYIPPTDAGPNTPSTFDPVNYEVPVCDPDPASGDGGQTRIRNQNTYTARMSDGLYVAVPGGARPLGDFQRAFVVYVRNDSYEDRSFRLTIAEPPQGVEASFDQFAPVASLDVEIARYSSVARTVFVSSTDPEAIVTVNVTEVSEAGPGGVIVPGGLTSAVFINGDASSPPPADSELLDAEDYNLSLMNRNVVNLSLMNLSLMNDPTMLSLMNLSLMNPALVSQELINLSLMNLSLMNLSLMNPSVANLSLMNLSLMNPAIYSLSLMNPALMTPAVTNLSLMNLSLMNPDLENLSLMNVPVEVQEATWTVENTGTATAAYSFNMVADNVPEEGFEFQLFVYRVYTTPVADGCELKEEVQHQMIVNVLDPEFLDPDEDLDRFLDPETDDWDKSNPTFTIPKGGKVLVTLWIIDLYPPGSSVDDGIEFTEEDVGAAVVAHGVNPDEIDEGGGGDQQQPFDSDFGTQSTIDPLVIDTTTLPDAAVGVAYSYTLTATGGQGPRTWSFQPGSAVPAGLNLDVDGNLSWTPATAGTYDFTVRVIDQTQQATQPLSITVNAIPMIPLSQRNALIALYDATNGDAWTDKTNWKTAGVFSPRGTECSWFGIQCGSPTVERINLDANNLVGTIPAEIGNLDDLVWLVLSSNNLSGPIPAQIGGLANLQYLVLQSNQLAGSIPPELGTLGNLRSLTLSENALAGSIPTELGNLANLTVLNLGDNQLTGTIPTELGGLSNLQWLRLGENQLTGTIPPELGTLSNLMLVNLGYNQLSGGIPPEFGNLPNLQQLTLVVNQLDGEIPPELGNLGSLTFLALSENQLPGAIPPELGNLANMTQLILSGNQLSGEIPAELGNLSNLRYLTLYRNQLSGAIPPELGNLINMRYMSLFDNQLDGSIPPEIGGLSNLEDLYIHTNQLTGTIPPQLGNLSNLQGLALERNQISGSIPTELALLTNLEYLSLYSNQLTGGIPPEIGDLSNLRYLYLGDNQLTGAIPPEIGNLINLRSLLLWGNQLAGPIPLALQNLTKIGAGDLNIRWNALFSTDPGLTAFLNSAQSGGDWQGTQTVAPTNFAVGSPATESVTLSWTPIAYTADTGRYEVRFSPASWGPFLPYGTTVDKTASSMEVHGLDPDTTYYFTIRSITDPHAANQNTVASNSILPVSGATLTSLVITSTSPPYGVVGSAYTYTLAATGGAGPFTWGLSSGSGALPDGLNLGPTGVISGIPTTTGTFDIAVTVTNGTQTGEEALSISVAPAGGGPVFLDQPATTTAGQSIPNFRVIVLDDAANPLPGWTFTLAIGNYACSTATLSPGAPMYVTGGSGIATISGISIDRGGNGYTLEATTTIMVSDPPVTAASDPFGVVGFCEASSMGTARIGASMTRLADGRVLIVGGADETNTPLSSAEIFDPQSGAWSPTGSMSGPRSIHTAHLMRDGLVVLTGGTSGGLPASGAALATSEIFDPAANGGIGAFSPGPAMTAPRMGHAATTQSESSLVVTGGRSNATDPAYLDTVSIYVPGGSFTPTMGIMATGRDNHSASLLADGRVLLAGGLSAPSTSLDSAEIFDAGTISPTDDMASARLNHTATTLTDGRVLVAGGTDGATTFATAETYDPEDGIGAFSVTDVMSTVRQQHAAAPLPDGKTLITGGITSMTGPALLLGSAEIFDPLGSGGLGSFANTHGMITSRRIHTMTELYDGRVLVTGGYGSAATAIAASEVFWPINGEVAWTRQIGTLDDERGKHIAVYQSGVYVAGTTSGNFPGLGTSEYLIARYDTNGNQVWIRGFGGGDVDLVDISAHSSGLYVVGTTYGGLPGPLGPDAYVRKYDLDGNEVWTRVFGTDDLDIGKAVEASDSGVYVVGITGGSLAGQGQIGNGDAFLRKYDFDGNEDWTRQFGTVEADYPVGVAVHDGGVYIGGETSGSFAGHTNLGSSDVFIGKFYIDGSQAWIRQFGTTEQDNAGGISAHRWGIYVSGDTEGTFPGETSIGRSDAFVSRYDLEGGEMWTRQFGTSSDDHGNTVLADDSGVYVGGEANNILPGQLTSGDDDAYAGKFDVSGNVVWYKQFGSPVEDRVRGIALDETSVYLIGEAEGPVGGQTYFGENDLIIIKITK